MDKKFNNLNFNIYQPAKECKSCKNTCKLVVLCAEYIENDWKDDEIIAFSKKQPKMLALCKTGHCK